MVRNTPSWLDKYHVHWYWTQCLALFWINTLGQLWERQKQFSRQWFLCSNWVLETINPYLVSGVWFPVFGPHEPQHLFVCCSHTRSRLSPWEQQAYSRALACVMVSQDSFPSYYRILRYDSRANFGHKARHFQLGVCQIGLNDGTLTPSNLKAGMSSHIFTTRWDKSE